MSSLTALTPAASTRARSSGLLKRAIPTTSFSFARVLQTGNATWPAGPVTRIFSPFSMAASSRRRVHGDASTPRRRIA